MAYLVTKENTKYKTFTDEYAFHGLKKDSTGLLTYTKVLLSSDEEVELTTGEGLSYGGLEDLQKNLDISNKYGRDKSLADICPVSSKSQKYSE